jgi:serine/threonine protein kinase/Tol biopolymer transport system component
MIWSRPLDPDRWRRLESLLDRALDLPGADRDEFLARECGDDPALAEQVREILRAGERSDDMLDTVAPRLGAELLGMGPAFPAPDRVGPYRIERLIGEGGMGTVYLAHRDDGEFDQQVALKLVRHGLHLDPRIVRRFREERQILAALNHPGIARLLDGGITGDNLPYFAMEYVDGLPITRYCDARSLGLEQRLELFARACDAVAHAHARKIVHRDIKPSNILVTDSGEPRLLDFGIAKLLDADPRSTELTRRSERLLTPEYASPEQIRGEPVVMASDVYALGVLLYELVTGRRPFTRVGRSAHELERAVLDEEPTRPSEAAPHDTLRRRLRGDLDAIILTAMSKLPSHRYPSAAELSADVARHLRGEPITASGARPVDRARRWARRHRLVVGGAGAAAIIATGAFAAMTVTTGLAGDPLLRTLRLSNPQHVTNEEGLELDPAISPDGNQVAYAAGGEGAMRIFVRQRDGSRAVAISGSLRGNHRRPRWSPDGTRILFQAERGLWLVPALGGSPQPVVMAPRDTATAHSPAWSPDGSSVAWVVRDTIYVRELAGERPRVLATATVPHSLSWSPDGRWIAMVSGNSEFVYHRLGNLGPSALYLLPARCATGASCAPILLAPPTSLNTSPAWLDAARLVFVSSRGGPRDLFAVRINSTGAAMEDPVPLSAGQDMHTVSVASDGRTLAYSLFRQNQNIWSLDMSAGIPRHLSHATRITSGQQTVEGMEISPDRQWIAFDANRTGYQDIYIVAASGGEAERVIATNQDKFHPSWSPDGGTLAFYTFHDGVRRTVTAPARGGAVQLIHPDGPVQEEHTPVWTRDGQGLVYFRLFGDGAQLYLVRRMTDSTWSAEQQLTRNGGMWPTFSADGSRMAYVANPGVVRVMGPELEESSSWVALDASDPGSNGVVAISSVIAPDGGTIFVKGEDAQGPGVWSVPAEDGSPQLVVRLDDGQRTSPRPEFTSDGRRIFFVLAEREADVWAVRLERR